MHKKTLDKFIIYKTTIMIHLISTQILLNRKINCNLNNYNTNNKLKIKEK